MSLQAKDLVWVIGQSAGWRYPNEIDTLKDILEGQQTTHTAVKPKAAPEQNAPSSIVAPQGSAERIEIEPVRHIYVSLPTKLAVRPSSATDTETTLSFEERVEKMRQRIASVDSPKAIEEAPEVDVKYSRSLNDIKQEYANWMQAQKRKQKTGFGLKQAGVTAFLVAGIIGSFWAIRYFTSHSSDQALLLNTTNVPLVKKTYPVAVQPAPVVRDIPQADKKRQERNENTGRVKHEKSNSLVKSKQPDSAAITEIAPKDQSPTVAEVNEPLLSTSKDSQATAAEKPMTVVDQLQLKAAFLTAPEAQKGMGGLAVTITNNSSQLMKVVAVDVIYYTEGMSEIDRKTLYFSNLQPGQALTHNAPAHKKAEGAYAQLGLVSSEAGSIFYASNK